MPIKSVARPRLLLPLSLLAVALASVHPASAQSLCGSSCASGTPPKVSLTSPNNNSKAAAPATFNLAATASDDGIVVRVDFYANGVPVDSDTTYPYTGKFVTSVPGSYAITAVALDNTNLSATSASRTVTATNIAPSVNLTAPANGASAASPGVFTLSANASDPDGSVLRVDFRNGSGVICRDVTAPFSCVYSGLAPGSYLISAVATDNIGASTTSSTATITVTGTAPGTVSETRSYYYDEFQRLCKRVNPESGASIVSYDAAGNIAYTAESSLSTNPGCAWDVTDGIPVYRAYDELNRLKHTWIPYGTIDVAQDYFPDGAVRSITAANYVLGTNYPVTTAYSYNARGLLTGESSINGQVQNTLGYGYDANGTLASLTYPDGQVVTFSPDGLGRTQQVAGPGTVYAKSITYYPGGAIKSFSYGNDVVHTMTQNARRLPTRSQDIKGTTVVLDDTYSFDDNGNVVDITDRAQNGLTTRGMGYDGLDRLTAVVSPGQWGTAIYAYDALDNITRADVGTRQYRYSYNPSTWRLDTIKSPAGATLFSMQYDPQGNLTKKNNQAYAFDLTNRLSDVVGLQKYRYDGLGRRVQTTDADGKTTSWIYSQHGQVLFTSEARRSQNLSYIYLGNTPVATRAVAWGTGKLTLTYQHTDSLSSPLAETDALGKILTRKSYEPYGSSYGGMTSDGTGYAGQVSDRDTGLLYMQQRYYDPTVGRFLSVDPLRPEQGGGLNQYAYALGSPLAYRDPDGRNPCTSGPTDCDDRIETKDEQTKREKAVDSGNAAGAVVPATAPVGPITRGLQVAGGLVADDATGVGVADDVAIPFVLAAAVVADQIERTYVTYTLSNKSTGEVYVGRTSGYGTPQQIVNARFSYHHMRLYGFSNPVPDKSASGPLGSLAIRGREQQLMDSLGGVGTYPVANSIRGVARLNVAGPAYHFQASKQFGEIAPYSGLIPYLYPK